MINGLENGRVTPVLGAGASLCGRETFGGEEWLGRYPPSSQELSAYLARKFKYPATDANDTADLLRVAQYIYAYRGSTGTLYDELHNLFAADFPSTPLHDFLASVPGALKDKRPPLILTTNYDDLMENALQRAGEQFDLVVYMAEGPEEGTFFHRPPDGDLSPIESPKENTEIDPNKRTVVLKIHGFVDQDPDNDSFVITEDHYIEFLTRTDLEERLPVLVLKRLRNCHFLFLGYSLRDWNLRAILLQLYEKRRRDRDWWAIQLDPDDLDRKSWNLRNVKVFDHRLDEYIAGLKARFEASGNR